MKRLKQLSSSKKYGQMSQKMGQASSPNKILEFFYENPAAVITVRDGLIEAM